MGLKHISTYSQEKEKARHAMVSFDSLQSIRYRNNSSWLRNEFASLFFLKMRLWIKE